MPKRYVNKKGTKSHLRTTKGAKIFSTRTTPTSRKKTRTTRKRKGYFR